MAEIVCGICLLDDSESGERLVRPCVQCDAVFHKSCLHTWFSRRYRKDCPMCSASMM